MTQLSIQSIPSILSIPSISKTEFSAQLFFAAGKYPLQWCSNAMTGQLSSGRKATVLSAVSILKLKRMCFIICWREHSLLL